MTKSIEKKEPFVMRPEWYYNIVDDFEKYPDCIIYIAYGGRKRGKTYSTLKYLYNADKRFCFVKRTLEDLELIYAAENEDAKKEVRSFAPFKSLNRDMKTNVRAEKVNRYVGQFCENGKFIGYIFAMSSVSKYKGVDISECDYLVFDEFIPMKYDRINRNEGIALLDLYLTISRDREERGKEPLKIILLANSTMISNPIFDTLEIIDDVAALNEKDEGYYIARNIMVHKIAEIPEVTAQTKIAETMQGTAWFDVSFANKFAYDDFTKVQKDSLKGFIPYIGFKYKQKQYFVYYNPDTGRFYGSRRKFEKKDCPQFDLNVETERIAFFCDYGIDLRAYTIDGYMSFETFLIYDLIVNFKKYFKI